MIWKDYLKLSEVKSYLKLARASKASPPLPPGGIWLMTICDTTAVIREGTLDILGGRWLGNFFLYDIFL